MSGQIRTYLGDITTLAVDAIVNAANSELARGGGVCGAIFAAAGPELDAACARARRCPTGDAVATPGFRLPARFVVHTVGPVWRGGDARRGRRCSRRATGGRVGGRAARPAPARSAFPAISTGIYGYPPDAAAEIAVRTLQACAGDLEVHARGVRRRPPSRRYDALLG